MCVCVLCKVSFTSCMQVDIGREPLSNNVHGIALAGLLLNMSQWRERGGLVGWLGKKRRGWENISYQMHCFCPTGHACAARLSLLSVSFEYWTVAGA